MITELKDVLLILLGWLLGLLSPVITTAIKDKREGEILKKALESELQELRYRLMLSVYLVQFKYGTLDHEFFEWAQSILTKYKGINSGDSLLKVLGPLLKLGKNEMAMYVEKAKEKEKPGSGLSLKKYSLSLLDTSMASFSKFDPIFRSHLLEIKTRIGFLNEIIDDTRYYYQLSFQNGISSENYAIANTNMINSHKFYASRARDIIGIIGKIVDY